MAEKQLGVAIHGAGWVAHAHAASWKKNPRVRVISVSDIDLSRAEKLIADVGLDCRASDRYEGVLRDSEVDIIDITGPSHVHAEQGIAAAEAGKHVLVEKPVALNLADLRALRDAVARSGVKSLGSFVLRWNPMVQTLKSLLERGAIGKPFYAEANYWHGLGPTHHAWAVHGKRATAGGAMLLAGCHAADALRWLLADEVAEVSAAGNNPKGNFEFDANVVALLKFRGGAVGVVSALLDCTMPYTLNIDLAGTAGTLRDNRVWSKELLPGQTDWAAFPTILPTSGDVHHHPFDGEINHFVECITQGRESHCNIADAYRTHELCLAIDQSIELGGRPVKLPLE
jgi:predicted dehydrogenase